MVFDRMHDDVSRWGDSQRDLDALDRWLTTAPEYGDDELGESEEPATSPANDYTAAPAVRLVATHCACCHRPLLDAESVERGVGPDCARRYGADESQREPRWERAAEALALAGIDATSLRGWRVDARDVANALIYRAAVMQSAPTAVFVAVALASVGYVRCASKIGRAVATVWAVVEEEREGDVTRVVVRTSRLDDATWRAWASAYRRAGAERDAARRVVVAPASARLDVWHAMVNTLPRPTLVVGTNDVTVIV